jgi:glycosyltransferase involved in cell wall biosynthesis
METTCSSLPRVSVIVPVFNSQQTIVECIESLLSQDYPNELYEIVVVDNNSTDQTVEIVERYPVKMTHQRLLQTPAATRNQGVCEAKGEYLAFIDADCVAAPGWLLSIIQPLNDPQVGAVCGHTMAYRPESLVEQFFAEHNRLLVNDQEPFVSLLTCNMACPKSIMDQVGHFDQHLPTIEDLEFGWRIQSIGEKRIVVEPAALVYHQYRASIRGLFHAYRRYGYSEILVDTLFRGREFCPRTPGQQLRSMLGQSRALVTYMLAFLRRCVTWPIHREGSRKTLWPLLLLVAESGNLQGKVQGLIATRLFSRNPYTSASDVRPSKTKDLYRR